MRGEVKALEGVCCAGKTTIVKRLAHQLGSGVIPELPEFGRNLFLPFTSPEAVRANAYRSVDIEKVRMRAAFGLSEIAPHVILDRSFLSTLALGYGAIDLIGTSAFKGLAEKVLTAVVDDELLLPDKTLYINVDGDTVQKRNETRSPKLDEYWVSPSRLNRQNEFYRSLAHITGIELIDGERSHEEVYADCLERSLTAPTVLSTQEVVGAVEEFTNHISVIHEAV